MASPALLPGSLTREVLSLILSYIDNASVLSFLLTSKSLYPYGIEALYSRDPTKYSRYPTKYWRRYRCSDIAAFAEHLSHGPLHLNTFILDNSGQPLYKDKHNFATACESMIANIAPGTTIRELDLSLCNAQFLHQRGWDEKTSRLDWDDKEAHDQDGIPNRGGRFLSRIAHIGGIERVILRPFPGGWPLCGRDQTFKTTQEVLEELAPLTGLKHITFINADIWPQDWKLHFEDGVLPNLKSIQFHYTMPDAPFELEHDELEHLVPYQKRGIFFEVTAYEYYNTYMTFYHPAIEYLTNPKDRRHLIRWLVRGEQYFQLHEHNHEIFMLDLISYQAPERNLILETIQPVEYEQPIALRITVHAQDSNMTSDDPALESNALRFSKLLPRQLSYLELNIRASLEVGFIPLLIQSLPSLNRLVLDTYTRHPKTVMRKIQEGSTCVVLQPQAKFTSAPYSIKILSSDIARPVIWSLELEPHEDPDWTFWVRKDDGEDEEGVIYGETGEYVREQNRAFEREMATWFGLGGGLKTVGLRVFAGRAWFSDSWRPYFEYDCVCVTES
jgi:hypothetical protein